MTHIFISYSRKDIDFARYVRALLENQGFPVWMDEKRLSAGMDWWDEIEANIDACEAFLVIMSPDSRESVYVRNEIFRAIDQNKLLFPVLLRGRHFGMIAHVQHEDMRGGLNDTFSANFVSNLREALGLSMTRTIRFEVLQGTIQSVEADVLLQKYVRNIGGVQRMLLKELRKANVEVDEEVLKDVGDTLIIDAEGAIASEKVAFIRTQWVGAFGYRQVREFATHGLAMLGTETPDAKHVIMTIHGVNTRLTLDEGESMLAQLAGLVDVLQDWQAPIALEKITIVEFDIDRVARIKKAIQGYFDAVDYAQPAPDVDWGYDLTFERDAQVESPNAGESDIKPYAVALFPEQAEFEDIFYYGIERPVHAMGLLCERISPRMVDDEHDRTTVQATLNRIKHASVVICDVTQISDWLYLQLGFAWGANIPTALITRDADSMPELGKLLEYEKIWQLEERLAQWLKTLRDPSKSNDGHGK